MPLTFKQLQDEVLNHGFDETYRPRVKVWLNEACERVARSAQIPDLTKEVTLTVTGNTVSLPSNLLRLLSVYDPAANRNLLSEPYKDIREYSVVNGNAVVYAVDNANGTLLLYPAPVDGSSLIVRYLASPSELSGDSDIPQTPGDYQDLLVTYALSRAFRAEDDFEASTVYRQQYTEDLAKLQNDVQYREIASRQVPGTWSR